MASTRWWSKDTVAVVTGSNKGIGLAIVKGLAKNGVTTILTARDTERGQEAVSSLKKQDLDSVVFHQLDVTSADSIDEFAIWVRDKFGGIDILINNAAITRGPALSYEGAKATLGTNYYGVKNVTSKLLPLLRPGARILNVSSGRGRLSHYGDTKITKALGDETSLTEDFVDSYAAKYLEDVEAGRWEEEGWTSAAYHVSKILLNAYTRAFAKTLSTRPEAQKVYVNAVCPGFVETDLNKHLRPQGQKVDLKALFPDFGGVNTAEEGADTAVWLALLADGDYPHGGFWHKREPLGYY